MRQRYSNIVEYISGIYLNEINLNKSVLENLKDPFQKEIHKQ